MTLTLADRIKHWREHRGLSVADVARGVGVAWPSAYGWEPTPDGRRPSAPKQEHLEKLVEVFGITMEQFYGPLPRKVRS